MSARFLAASIPTLALLVITSPALAGSPAEPELTDPTGDCAVPYGNAYLDVVAAWVSDETETAFRVNVAIAAFEEALAEGSGYTVQFTHQGVEWGVVATYGAFFADGWGFATGRVTADDSEGFEDAEGSFTPGTPAVIEVEFPKRRFPHGDASDNALRGFRALTADLRPAVPFFVTEEVDAPVDSDGRWVVCDEAESDATYEFTVGRHSGHDAGHAPTAEANATAGAAAEDRAAAPADPEAPAAAASDAPAATPSAGTLAAVGAVAFAAAAAARGVAGRRR